MRNATTVARPSCLTATEGITLTSAWSPASPILAVSVSLPETQLFIFDPASERRTFLYENIDESCGDYCDGWEPSGPPVDDPAWSADGRRLAYTVQDGEDYAVHVVDVEPWLDELGE